MTRTSRMLLVLAIFAIAGVAILGVMARRYGSILDRRAVTGIENETAQRLVDAFIEVRSGRSPAGDVTDEALADAGIDRASYLKMDGMFRAWNTNEASLAEPYQSAFRQRREELGAIDP